MLRAMQNILVAVAALIGFWLPLLMALYDSLHPDDRGTFRECVRREWRRWFVTVYEDIRA